jgi:hypothetical protein
MTAANLAELAAAADDTGTFWGTQPKGRSTAELQIHAQAHVATSTEPVTNTMWKVRACLKGFRVRVSQCSHTLMQSMHHL